MAHDFPLYLPAEYQAFKTIATSFNLDAYLDRFIGPYLHAEVEATFYAFWKAQVQAGHISCCPIPVITFGEPGTFPDTHTLYCTAWEPARFLYACLRAAGFRDSDRPEATDWPRIPLDRSNDLWAPPVEDPDPLRLYCVFLEPSVKLMKGNRGKLAAQAGHAYLHSFLIAQAVPEKYGTRAQDYLMSSRAYKIACIVPDIQSLQALHRQLDHIPTSLVTDAGLTVFNEPTITCLGIGPVRKSEVPALAALKLFI